MISGQHIPIPLSIVSIQMLLVEDNPGDVRLVHEMLRDQPHIKLEVADCLAVCLGRLDQGGIDLVLLDLGLRDSQGLDTLTSVAQAHPALPIVALTGLDDDVLALRTVQAGGQDYLTKNTVTPEVLRRTIRHAIERKQVELQKNTVLEALRKSEENFRRSLDESPLGIRVVSADGETIYGNRAILDIYGYDNIEELRSTPAKKRYTLESYAEHELRKKKRVNGEDYSSEYELSIIRKTGEIRRLQIFRKEILWNGQKQFQTICQDITEQKQVEGKLRETLSDLRNAIDGTIQVISAITEKRDPYTSGHQRRVADLARAIGQEMGLAADRVKGLHMAGEIHDIGKVSIPADILSNPARLSELEYKMIQAHAQVGHDILGEVKFAWPIAKMILQHHERMDGSGYPQGLKGDDILLESRILAVSDVVEAMASHRPYRSALGIEAALKEIENNKGLLYDPAIVSACLTLFREKGYALKE
jgi:PAS domain S-box-containing protein